MSFSNIMDSNSYAGVHDDPATESLITARERVLGPSYRLFYERPVHLVRGQGSHLFDSEGNRYLDAYNNVASVGHCHPHVVGAVTRQLSAPQHPHAVSPRGHRRLLGTSACHHAHPHRPGDVCVHRLRGQ